MRAPIKKSLKATNVGIKRFIYNEKSKTNLPRSVYQSHIHVTDSFSSVFKKKNNIEHAFERVYIFILLLTPACMDHGGLGNSKGGREENRGS